MLFRKGERSAIFQDMFVCVLSCQLLCAAVQGRHSACCSPNRAVDFHKDILQVPYQSGFIK